MPITRKNRSMWRVYEENEQLLGEHIEYKEAIETRDDFWAAGGTGEVIIRHSDQDGNPAWEIHEKAYDDGPPVIISSSSSSSDSSDSSISDASSESSASSQTEIIDYGPVNEIFISSSEGNDGHNGRTEGTSIRSIFRAKNIAYDLRNADPNAVLSFRFKRGDVFGAFDMVISIRADGGGSKLLAGPDIDNPTMFTDYGDPNDPRPHFELGGNTGFRNNGDGGRMTNMHWRSLSFKGTGTSVGGLGGAENMTIEDCDMNGTPVIIQKWSSGRIKNLRIINTVIWNCGDGDSGIFINGIDGVLYDRVVLYRNGFKTPMGQDMHNTPDEDLIISTREHGTYIVNDCTGIEIINSFAVFNSGGGLQMRSAGLLEDSVIYDNQRTGVDWGLVNGSPTGVGGKTGIARRNYVRDDGAAWGFGASNIREGHVHDNIFVWGNAGWRAPLYLRSDWGPNTHSKEVPGGERVGLNNLIIENNDVYGHLNCQYNGWGKLGGEGVTVRNNRIEGAVTYSDFDDPDGKLVIEDGQEGATLPVLNEPDHSPETIQRILNREVDAKTFIQEIKGNI